MYLCRMVEREARRALHIEVSAVPERVVGADDDLAVKISIYPLFIALRRATHRLTASGQLHRHELFLIVLLECGRQVGDDVRRRDRQGFDICEFRVNIVPSKN